MRQARPKAVTKLDMPPLSLLRTLLIGASKADQMLIVVYHGIADDQVHNHKDVTYRFQEKGSSELYERREMW